MTAAVDIVRSALARGTEARPAVGGFPVLAEALRAAGVRRNHWFVPAMTSVFDTAAGTVVNQGAPLATAGFSDQAGFDEEAVVEAIRADQRGQSTFLEFMAAIYAAGVIRYEVDFEQRTCTYVGAGGDRYIEAYAAASLPDGAAGLS